MTTPQQQTRIALSEIPERLEALRMSTTPTVPSRRRTLDTATSTIFNPPTMLDNATNVALSQEFSSPVPSPDEIIIRQRGQRRMTTNWSPDKLTTPARSPFQRTPTKIPLLTSGMILRSSPRKRLTMGLTPPEPIPSIQSPNKNAARQQLWPGSPIVKKMKLADEERPIVRSNTDAPLEKLLLGLTQQQLVAIILHDVAGGDAQKLDRLRANLPMADIEPLEDELQHARRNVLRSLPTSRLCKKTDSSAYSRAAIHLAEFKRLLSAHTKLLNEAAHWDALLDYVTLAWTCVRGTPNWDSMTHNVIRRQCFKLLACHCIAAVKNGGILLGANRLHTLERNLKEWSKDYEDILTCVDALNKMLTKSHSNVGALQ